ncbi:Universal stress protein family protein [Halomicrobium zhouii]|uniref:Universal stress protein family protein n=1 Tax=Halomicrobium zhouii TaxID=767519 RepID=A0A1I6K6R6_9EURY|nr:universal stress protein [Halomicrobium zhouii]SFR86550.1 Universal stress protein family protein [Halomicrobium zhouii]
MTRFLVATNSVHVTAAAVDYLEDRLDPGADEVVVVGVTGPDASGRDVADAANVARARLAASTPTVESRTGEVVDELLAAVDEHDPEEVIIGANGGEAGVAGVGSTAQALLAELARPVVVVPTPALS